jgi:hypothetical protein
VQKICEAGEAVSIGKIIAEVPNPDLFYDKLYSRCISFPNNKEQERI